MRSIRAKLFLQIGGLFLFIIGLLLLTNNFLLQIYFVNQQKDTVEEYYQLINDLNTSDYLSQRAFLNQLETSVNVDIFISDSNDVVLYQSRSYDIPGGTPAIPEIIITEEEIINDNYSFIYATDPHIGYKLLILEGTLDTGDNIQIRIPLDTIRRNIDIFNQFLLYIGIVSFLLSMMLAYLVSNHFTNPIRKINQIAKKMKELDFSNDIHIKSKDEIGELAITITELSNELEKTIKDLSNQNVILEKEMNENIKLSQRRRELLNNVSHELKTPLTLMQGYAEGLKLNIATSNKKRDFYCDVIMDETVKMNQLVEELLELDQSEFGDRQFVETETNLSYFLQKIIDKFEKPIQDKKIALTTNIPKNIKYKFGTMNNDRILTNYITNAINYCDKHLKMSVTLKKQDDTYIVEVFNTSDHFKTEDIEKIWDSFYKVDKSRHRASGGHGLGLAIVKAIQEKQHKAYGVKNVDHGVVFYYEV